MNREGLEFQKLKWGIFWEPCSSSASRPNGGFTPTIVCTFYSKIYIFADNPKKTPFQSFVFTAYIYVLESDMGHWLTTDRRGSTEAWLIVFAIIGVGDGGLEWAWLCVHCYLYIACCHLIMKNGYCITYIMPVIFFKSTKKYGQVAKNLGFFLCFSRCGGILMKVVYNH